MTAMLGHVLTCRVMLQRLQAKIIKLVDVSYGGENGFNQAIELAAESLQNVKFIQEKKLIGEPRHKRLFCILVTIRKYLLLFNLLTVMPSRVSILKLCASLVQTKCSFEISLIG